MEEIDEEEQTPKKFDKKLDNSADISFFNDLHSHPASYIFVQKYEIKNILAQLARNIELIDSEYPKNYDKGCRHINYWLNEKIGKNGEKIGQSISSEITAVFNDVKWKKKDGERVCTKNDKPYSAKNAKLMKQLDDYCEIRDNNECNALKDKNHCIKCNKYIEKKKEEFTRNMESTCPQRNCEWGEYTFACRCTLNDMDLTFPVKNCDELYKEPEIKKLSLLEIGFFVIFTPIGSITNRFRRRKYDLKRNIEKLDDDRYTSYHSDTMPANSANEHYYIEYSRQHN
ncbi:VIR protein [Plasmodium vivax]|uniref:VIR protein n=1 Tax=Plasmodium vivax TaxID=5855 RepID=A0A1G4E8V3_PLAVI|nr:VIR protein [Plasmodium vivax]